MAKVKTQYQCTECGASTPKWIGQCPECKAWNSLTENIIDIASTTHRQQRHDHLSVASAVQNLNEVVTEQEARISTGISELDRAIGGGLIQGSVVLLGGDPGIGKSTLLIQMLSKLSTQSDLPSLYVTAEESSQQISLRAKRLELNVDKVKIYTENHLEKIIRTVSKEQPVILIIDSIQTVYSDIMQSAPGAVAQVRECTAQLVRLAKQTNTMVFLVGHVTKEGSLAGPRVLEHMVDTVLYFEGDPGDRYRVIRAVKNRYGAVNELGVFAMTEHGLKAVSNPSAIFLSRHEEQVPGSVVMVSREGSRPILLEIQALVDESHSSQSRRLTVGLDQNRLAMLLAVMHRHMGIVTYDQDVFVNAVGGVRINETAADLAIVLAVISSLKNKPIPSDWIVFGEVGLAGEVRPVQNGEDRLKEAAKHGFKQAVIPKANTPKNKPNEIVLHPVATLSDLQSLI